MSEKNQIASHRESNFTSGLFWGLVLGMLGTFVFATKKGAKIRKYLSENGQKIFSELEKLYQESIEVQDAGQDKFPLSSPATAPSDLLPKKNNLKSQTKSTNHNPQLQTTGRKSSRRFFKKSGRILK